MQLLSQKQICLLCLEIFDDKTNGYNKVVTLST